MAKSRRQRTKSGTSRKAAPSRAGTAASPTATKTAPKKAASKRNSKKKAVTSPASDYATLWQGRQPDAATNPPPIKQTASWKLIPVSCRLWFRNYNASIGLFILPPLLTVLGLLLAPDLNRINNWTLLGVTLIAGGLLWAACNVPASYYLQLQAIRGQEPRLRDCYRRSLRFVPRLIGLAALVSLLVFGGLLLLLIPGIILIRRYILSPYYLMDGDTGIREAMRRSADDSKPASMYIWGVYGTFVLVNLFAIVLFTPIFPPYGSLVGAFVTSLYIFGPALRYKEVALRQPAETALLPDEISAQ